MYVVRVNFKNGQMINFVFLDVGKAKACATDCAKAKLDGSYETPKPAHLTHVHVFDEAGREAWLDGSQMQGVQFVDVELEVKMNTRLAIVVGRTERDLLAMAGEGPPQATTNGRAPMAEPTEVQARPAIGSFGA